MIISDVNWTGRPSKDKEQDSWDCAIWQTHVHANSCLKLLTWILAVHSHSKTMYDTHAHARGQFPMRKVRLGEIKHLPQSYTPTTWEKNFINCCENQQDYGEVLGIGEMNRALRDLDLSAVSASHQIGVSGLIPSSLWASASSAVKWGDRTTWASFVGGLLLMES